MFRFYTIMSRWGDYPKPLFGSLTSSRFLRSSLSTAFKTPEIEKYPEIQNKWLVDMKPQNIIAQLEKNVCFFMINILVFLILVINNPSIKENIELPYYGYRIQCYFS